MAALPFTHLCSLTELEKATRSKPRVKIAQLCKTKLVCGREEEVGIISQFSVMRMSEPENSPMVLSLWKIHLAARGEGNINIVI